MPLRMLKIADDNLDITFKRLDSKKGAKTGGPMELPTPQDGSLGALPIGIGAPMAAPPAGFLPPPTPWETVQGGMPPEYLAAPPPGNVPVPSMEYPPPQMMMAAANNPYLRMGGGDDLDPGYQGMDSGTAAHASGGPPPVEIGYEHQNFGNFDPMATLPVSPSPLAEGVVPPEIPMGLAQDMIAAEEADRLLWERRYAGAQQNRTGRASQALSGPADQLRQQASAVIQQALQDNQNALDYQHSLWFTDPEIVARLGEQRAQLQTMALDPIQAAARIQAGIGDVIANEDIPIGEPPSLAERSGALNAASGLFPTPRGPGSSGRRPLSIEALVSDAYNTGTPEALEEAFALQERFETNQRRPASSTGGARPRPFSLSDMESFAGLGSSGRARDPGRGNEAIRAMLRTELDQGRIDDLSEQLVDNYQTLVRTEFTDNPDEAIAAFMARVQAQTDAEPDADDARLAEIMEAIYQDMKDNGV